MTIDNHTDASKCSLQAVDSNHDHNDNVTYVMIALTESSVCGPDEIKKKNLT